MNTILYATFVVLCSTSALASQALKFVKPVEGHPDQCFVEEKNIFYDINQSWQLEGYCGEASCNSMTIRGKQQMIISYSGCGVVHAEPPCYLSENKDLSYPDCCPDVVCPEFEETEQIGNGIEDGDNDDSAYSFSTSGEQGGNRDFEDDLYGYKKSGGSRYRMY